MSSTTTNIPVINSPLSGNLLGAILYNIEYMISPGLLTSSQIASYSDLTMMGSGDWVNPTISLDPVYHEKYDFNTAEFKASNPFEWHLNDSYYSSVGNQYYLYSSNQEEYLQNLKDNSILGLTSLLPWSTYIVQCPSDKNYYGSHKYGDSSTLKKFNDLDWPSLMLKAQTIGILVITFFAVKITYKIVRKKI